VHKDAARRLKTKIKHARVAASSIVQELAQFDEVSEQQSRDTALLQHFILEQFSRIKRYALRRQFFQFETQPRLIRFWKWFLVWAFLISLWVFCALYILFWAASQGDATTTGFTVQFALFLVQDLLVNQIIQIYVIHVLTIELLRPQLKTINHVLNHVMVSKAARARVKGSHQQRHGVSDIVQHVSGACRAARDSSLANLPSARLLMNVDDRDVQLCRKVRSQKMGMGAFILMGVVAVLAVSNDFVTTLLLELVIPTLWCFFLLLNSIVVGINYLYVVAAYCGGLFLLGVYLIMYSPARRFIRQCPERVLGRQNLFHNHKSTVWMRKVQKLHRESVREAGRGRSGLWPQMLYVFHRSFLAMRGCMVWVILWSWRCMDFLCVSTSLRQREDSIWRDMNRAQPRGDCSDKLSQSKPQQRILYLPIPQEVEELRAEHRQSRRKNFWEASWKSSTVECDIMSASGGFGSSYKPLRNVMKKVDKYEEEEMEEYDEVEMEEGEEEEMKLK